MSAALPGSDADDDLSTRFDVAESSLDVGGRTYAIAHPRNSDDLINEEDFVRDERMPYWADIWPSARILADRVSVMDGAGRRLLELGCGAGLVATVASVRGFDVLATDYYEDALAFARHNARRNGGGIATRLLDWRGFPDDLGTFDVVVASDVLYELTNAPLIAAAFHRAMRATGVGLITDPGRIAAGEFLHHAERIGLSVEKKESMPFSEGEQNQTINVYRLTRHE